MSIHKNIDKIGGDPRISFEGWEFSLKSNTKDLRPGIHIRHGKETLYAGYKISELVKIWENDKWMGS